MSCVSIFHPRADAVFPLCHPSFSLTGSAPTYYLSTPLLSPNRNCTHYDITSALFCSGAKLKKADSNYYIKSTYFFILFIFIFIYIYIFIFIYLYFFIFLSGRVCSQCKTYLPRWLINSFVNSLSPPPPSPTPPRHSEFFNTCFCNIYF